jgi:hypothetical protein
MSNKTKRPDVNVDILPQTKIFTVAQLREIGEGGLMTVPNYQRWIRESNKKELEASIKAVGMLRSPVIHYVKQTEKYVISDGNHIRELIIDMYPLNTKVSCIFRTAETPEEASNAFKFLNTSGRTLNWVDITNLYMHIHSHNSVYGDIWVQFLHNPKDDKAVTKKTLRGFSVPTIIEFLTKNKSQYRAGYAAKKENYEYRMVLLRHLMGYAEQEWKQKLQPIIGNKRPSGTALNGFANYWFSKGYHVTHSAGDFLDIVTEIYIKKSRELVNGTLVILRDNAGSIMRQHMIDRSKSKARLNVKSRVAVVA